MISAHNSCLFALLFFLAVGLDSPSMAEDGPRSVEPNDRPNILMILADDMGYGDLGCYGSKQIETPVLDRLAKSGIRVTQGYNVASVCAPSRAGILSGRYPHHFGFEHNLVAAQRTKRPDQLGIALDHKIMSQFMKEAGYRTGLIGKWHVGEAVPGFHPNKRGFDHFFGMLKGSHGYFPTVEKNHLEINGRPIRSVPTPYLTDWFSDEAIAFVSKQTLDRATLRDANERPRPTETEPWFLFLSYNSPHTPLQAKPKDLERFAHIPHKGRRTYAAMQWNMDQNIGRVLDSLRKTKQLENTLVVFFSDNGGSVTASHACNAPLNGTKGTFWEGGIRVPFIFSWPNGLPSGTEFNQPMSSLDLIPTFMSAANTAPNPLWTNEKGDGNKRTLDGVDLLPYLRGDNPGRPHQTLHWRMTMRSTAVRHGDWKLHRPNHSLPMLFNLAEDVSEQHDLYHERPDKVAELLAVSNRWQESLEGTPNWHERVYWQKNNREIHNRKFKLTQPERDEDYSAKSN